MSSRDGSRRPHRVVVAPDKFKGSATAREVALALATGFERVLGDRCELRSVPMADGGEGTVDAFLDAGARAVRRTVSGPLGEPVDAVFALDGDVAIVEMATASGLALVPVAARDAGRASTYGTGELILAALDAGARRIVVGIGGSATTDGGAGMLAALGARFAGAAGSPLGRGGLALSRLVELDLSGLDPRLARTAFDVAADVDNPLCGPSGAAAVYGAQKGATPEEARELDVALARLADIVAEATGRELRELAGAGAAGGLGFGLASVLSARLRPGVDIVAELRGLEAALRDSTLCLTGEGRIDEQTLRGKTVSGVARLAGARGVPVVAFAGSLDPRAEAELFDRGVVCMPIVAAPVGVAAAMADAPELLARAASRVARLIDRTAASLAAKVSA